MPENRRLPKLGEVNVYVRDIEAAVNAYRNTLGFSATPSDVYPLPSGLAISEIIFRTGPTLEFRTVLDLEKAKTVRPRAVDFLSRHEGVLHLVLNVPSAAATARALRARGFSVVGPEPAAFRVEGRIPFRYLLFDGFFDVPDSAGEIREGLPSRVLAFSELAPYMKRRFQKKLRAGELKAWLRHPNTARGIRSVWIAVQEVEATIDAYLSVGLIRGRERRLRRYGAVGREVRAKGGQLLLLESEKKEGAVASFLRERGEGIMGLSIEVQDLSSARRLIERQAGRTLSPYLGTYGRSVLVPAEAAYGVWVELFQRG